ncbi:MAG TPA: substrate-binding domain-containing protein [Armatimonadota bacterium]|nr:substrate-binding domain-containing protein [Armatimonadota bacterium]
MKRRGRLLRRRLLRRISAFLGAGILLAGCGGGPSGVAPSEPVELNVYVPCVLSGPMQKIIGAYEETEPGAAISTRVDKPMAMLEAVPEARDVAGVVVTLGDREMEALVAAGAVSAADVKAFAVNTYPIVVVAAADAIPGVTDLSGLASPEVKAVAIEDPERSTLGDRAQRALEGIGLWAAVEPKVVRLEPDAMVLGELMDGRADAAVIFRDCLFGESGGNPPKTIRIVGEIPQDDLPPILYQAAPLAQAPNPEVGRRFVDFLVSEGGRKALEGAGLSPSGTR